MNNKIYIKKSQTTKKINSTSCNLNEYCFPTKNISFATARINGRYPLIGKAINNKCDQIYFIINGQGTIHHETGNYKIKTQDAFYFPRKKWYWVEGQSLEIAVFNSPAWTPKQYKIEYDVILEPEA